MHTRAIGKCRYRDRARRVRVLQAKLFNIAALNREALNQRGGYLYFDGMRGRIFYLLGQLVDGGLPHETPWNIDGRQRGL